MAIDWEASFSPLMGAACRGDVEKARSLIKDGADIEERSDDDLTAVMIASMMGKVDMVSFLIEAGADIESRNDFGWTAIKFARENKHREVEAVILAGLVRREAEAEGLELNASLANCQAITTREHASI